MSDDILQGIRDDVKAGRNSAAREALQPLLKSGKADAEILYLLGRTFFEKDKATARYFFERALALKPDYAEAGQYEAKCGSSLDDLEDFNGPRHVKCGTCALQYRDHEPFCPYCGAPFGPHTSVDADDSLEAQLKEAGKEVIHAFVEFTEREDVKAAKEKITAAGKQAMVKAKEFGESEQAQELKATARAISVVAARKAKSLGRRKEVQAVKEKATELGQEAAEKAKAFSEREDVREAVGKAGEKSKNILLKVARYAGEEIARIRDSEGGLRAWLVGKWLVIALVTLLFINWLFGD